MTSLVFQTRVTYNAFPRVRKGMLTVARQIVEKAAMDMEAQMKSRVPVDTGFLKSSIQARQVGGNALANRLEMPGAVTAEYGLYVEYGTRFTRAQPFFFPAIATVSPVFQAAMRRIVQT